MRDFTELDDIQTEASDNQPAYGYERFMSRPVTEPEPITPARIAALRKMPYEMYLQSPEWRARRAEIVRLYGYRCALCGLGREHDVGLVVHHKTYERLGNEDYDDLIVICRRCHEREHGIDP